MILRLQFVWMKRFHREIPKLKHRSCYSTRFKINLSDWPRVWIRYESFSYLSMNYESFHAFPWTMSRFVFMLFYELWIDSFSYISMNRFHEFEKSQASAEQAQQFSNFMDRGFALAVKKIQKNCQSGKCFSASMASFTRGACEVK